MRRRIDPALVAACVLLCGGWVCQSNADNRCPGALTCDVDVANVCCPFDSPVWCEHCVASGSGCTTEVRTCTDQARVLECSFEAKILSIQCVPSQLTPESWTVTASGTLTGCGEEVAFITVAGKHVDVSCGSWSDGVYTGCIPPEDGTSTTNWSISQTIQRTRTDTGPVEVDVVRGHADVLLASMTAACTP